MCMISRHVIVTKRTIIWRNWPNNLSSPSQCIDPDINFLPGCPKDNLVFEAVTITRRGPSPAVPSFQSSGVGQTLASPRRHLMPEAGMFPGSRFPT